MEVKLDHVLKFFKKEVACKRLGKRFPKLALVFLNGA